MYFETYFFFKNQHIFLPKNVGGTQGASSQNTFHRLIMNNQG